MTSKNVLLRLVLLVLVAVIAPGSLQSPPATPPPAPIPWPALSPIVDSEPVGYVAASTSVSPTGEYQISIPLDVPPGRAGMAPAVGLSYGSNAGNDILGVGWTLHATSAIQRCASTIAEDGAADGVDFTDDRFCLDGRKLIAVAGAYGAIGTEYRTERDPFTRVLGIPGPGGVPTFEVDLPDGRVSTYEPVIASHIPDSIDPRESVPFAYMLAETHDRNGNGIHYTYSIQETQAGGLSVLLVSIDYTSFGLLDGRRQISFVYEDRPDPAFAYTAGVRTRMDKRLSRVDMRAPNPIATETVWSYGLEYGQSPDSARSRLLRVRKLDVSGTSVWAKEFEWLDHARPTFDFNVQWDWQAEPLTEPAGLDVARVTPADLDGDGKDELIGYFSNLANGLLFSTGDSGLPLGESTILDGVSLFHARPMDRQNDGRSELVVPRWYEDGSASYEVLRWNRADGTFQQDQGLGAGVFAEPFVIDMDGNGWADTLFDSNPGDFTSTYHLIFGGAAGFGAPTDTQISTKAMTPPLVLDIDGDGRGDVFTDDPDSFPEYWGPSFIPQHTTAIRRDDANHTVSDKRWDLGPKDRVALADINGDGLKDAVYIAFPKSTLLGTTVRFNQGNGFGPDVLLDGVIVKSPNDRPAYRAADFDRDGNEDLLVFRENGDLPYVAVELSRPGGFVEVPLGIDVMSGLGWGNWDLIKVGDFNGDGLPDIAYWQEIQLTPDPCPCQWDLHLMVATQTPGESDVIAAIRDEHAANPRETVTYTRDLDHVSTDKTCDYPQKCIQRGMLLVDEVKTYRPDSVIPQRRTRYQFAGPRVDVTGRGFLGFSRVVSDDLDSRARTITTYDNSTRDGTAYPFAGLPSSTETIVPILPQGGHDGTFLTTPNGLATARVHRVQSKYKSTRQYGNKAYFVHPTDTVETEWEQPCDIGSNKVVLLGSTPAPARETHHQLSFDSYGNLLQDEYETVGGVHGIRTSEFDNRPNDWLLRLPSLHTVAEAEAGQPLPEARVTSMTYDSRGRPDTVIREPSRPEYKVTTAFEYTDTGLLSRTITLANGLPNRHVETFYDDEGVFAYATRNDLNHVSKVLRHPALGVPVVTEDPNGVQVRSYYDGFGRLRRVEPDGGMPANFSLEAWSEGEDAVLGIRTNAVASDGSKAYQNVDALGRVRESGRIGFDGDWVVSAVDYTAYGAPYLRTRPGLGAPGLTTLTQFDTLGRTQWVSAPDGTSATFSNELFATTATDASGRVHRAERDKDGRPSRTLDYDDDGQPILTAFEYGDFGQLWHTIDAAGNTTTFEYDFLGRRRSTIDPDRGQEFSIYDKYDQLTTTFDAVHTIDHHYDVLGRLIQTDDTHGSPPVIEHTTFTYDGSGARGKLTSAESPDGVVTDFEYDAHGRPTKTTWTIEKEAFTFEQTFSPDLGRPEKTLYPEFHGRQRFFTEVGYNEHGYATAVSTEPSPALPMWHVLARTPDGHLEKARWQGGRVETRHYHPISGRLDEIRVDLTTPYDPAPLYDVLYEYHQADLWRRTDVVMEREETFHYDSIARLARYDLRSTSNRHVDYTYDPLGNLAAVHSQLNGVAEPDETLTYNPNNRPHAARVRTVGAQPGIHYEYDGRGRMIESDGRGIEYTSADLPRTITDATHRTTLKYDAFGARVMKRVAPVLTPDAPISTTLTLAGLYERRTEGEHVDHRFYVHGDGGPVAEVVFHEDKTPEETHYLIRDAHGSISAVLAPDGSVVERLFYEPFGARVSSDGAPVAAAVSGVPLGFTGHREDDDLGLIHMNGRVYDPTLRRFWTPDPLVGNSLAGQTWNPYSYVWNNPLRYIDPSGYLGTDLDADTSLLDRIGSWLSDFLRPDKEMVRRNRPEKQLLPGGSSGGQTDTQSESTASSANGISIAPDSLQTVERSRPGVPAKEPKTSLLTILAHLIPAYATVDAGLSAASANFEDIKKASDAMTLNNPSAAADHLLKVPERTARALGEPILGGIRGAVDLPGDAMDAVNAETTGERVRAAVETGKDLLGMGSLAAIVIGGSSGNAGPGVRKGTVVLDTNVLIDAVEGGQAEAVLLGRSPIVPITVAKEFLRGGGSAGALRAFLADTGGRLGVAGSEATAGALQQRATTLGRVLQIGDARVVAGALKEGLPLITSDKRLGNFMQAVGLPFERF